MSVKVFDINRLVKIKYTNQPAMEISTYISHDSICGIEMRDGNVIAIFTNSETIPLYYNPWPIEEFEAEVERAMKQIIDDQNQELSEFRSTLKRELEKAKESIVEVSTDKIADYN